MLFTSGIEMVKTLQHNMSCLVSDIRDPMSHLDALLSRENVSYDEYRKVQSKLNKEDKVCIFILCTTANLCMIMQIILNWYTLLYENR